MLGIVTIGQTPRPDIERACHPYAGGTAIHIVGALDGLTREEIRLLENRDGPYPLLVRLADGATAEVPLQALVPRVTACAANLCRGGCADWSSSGAPVIFRTSCARCPSCGRAACFPRVRPR